MTDAPKPSLEQVATAEDPVLAARNFSTDELERMKVAEEFFDLQHRRKKRSTRLAVASQALVGYVAFAGLIVNAYQSYSNYQKQLKQQASDQERWNKEFERSKQSDKYRAFFETTVLATDQTNPDKRLVGYALLQEFVNDKDYNNKAALMLEESLFQELRADTSDHGLDEQHKNAVIAIVTALSQTTDCHALDRPARSIEKIAHRHTQTGDIEETQEVFAVYARRVLGRAATICPTLQDFAQVRRPLQTVLTRLPEAGELKGKVTQSQADARIARILVERCERELEVGGGSECADILEHYEALCEKADPKACADDADACSGIKDAAKTARAQANRNSIDNSANPAPTP